MKNRIPITAEGRSPLPPFAPVPRLTARHDGWTPDRQRAFIAALADTGSVSRAADQVNMSSEGAYYLRRQPGAESFRAAWSAALDFGVARMKDIAFERAVEGTLVPVVSGGRLIGYRRAYNDRLLMFCLRHYGEDRSGKRTTINYFSTKATAGALLAEFGGVALDGEAQAAIAQALAECAARRRLAEGGPADPAELFFAAEREERMTTVYDVGYSRPRRELRRVPAASDNVVQPDAFLEGRPQPVQPDDQYRADDAEMPWRLLDDEEGMAQIEAAVAGIKATEAERLLTSREAPTGTGKPTAQSDDRTVASLGEKPNRKGKVK